MGTTLARLVDAFAELKVLVVGDAMLDSYLEGFSNRLCREAPVPVVTLSRRENAPGGAANTAVNISSLGARVTFLSVIGDDPEGLLLRQNLRQQGVSIDHLLVRPSRQTLAKHRVMAGSQLLVRFDQGTTEPVDPDTEQALIDRLYRLVPQCDAVIVSDYDYGILTPRVIAALAEIQAGTPFLLAVDSKDLAAYRQVGVTVVKPNYREAVALLHIDALEGSEERVEQIVAHQEKLFEIIGAHIIAVTLDTDGSVVFEQGSPTHRTYAQPGPNSRAAGAGDTFLSAFTLALAAGAHTPAAAELASVAAEIVVHQDGTVACSADALKGYVSATEKYVTELSDLLDRIAFYRQQGQRIIFTSGCFDILHRGHITYLNRAKALGGILVLALNTDESVARLKGPTRPINTVEDRAQVLAALSCIDHIVPFSEDVPTRLIEAIKPEVYVKGGDYTRETLPEVPLIDAQGGEVHILPYVEEVSTTSIIKRIREVYTWPANNRRAAVQRIDS